MKRRVPRLRVLPPAPLALTLVYIGMMSLVVYQLWHSIRVCPIPLFLRLDEPEWPFGAIYRAATLVSVLLVVWLWLSWRASRSSRGGLDSVPYLGAALLLALLQRLVASGLEPSLVVTTVERIVP